MFTTVRLARLAAPLRGRDFRLIYCGQVVSGIGDWLDYLAIVVLITFTWRLGADALSTLSIALLAPWGAVGPFAGVLADRLPPRLTMIVCDLVRVPLVLGYLFAHSFSAIIVILLVKTGVGVLFTPASQAAVRRIVPGRELLAAMSTLTAAAQVTKVIGAVAGGVIIGALGTRTAFAADAASFAISAAFLAFARVPRAAAALTEPARRGLRAMAVELWRGLLLIFTSRNLLAAVGCMSVTVFLSSIFDSLAPLELSALGLDASLLSFAIAALGAGQSLGSVLVGFWADRGGAVRLMAISQIMAGALIALVGAAGAAGVRLPAAVWLVPALGIGLASAGILVLFAYLLQRESPPGAVGRVTAGANAVPLVLPLAAPPLAAAAANRLGVGPVFALAGLALVVAGLAIIGVSAVVTARRHGPLAEVVAHQDDAP